MLGASQHSWAQRSVLACIDAAFVLTLKAVSDVMYLLLQWRGCMLFSDDASRGQSLRLGRPVSSSLARSAALECVLHSGRLAAHPSSSLHTHTRHDPRPPRSGAAGGTGHERTQQRADSSAAGRA